MDVHDLCDSVCVLKAEQLDFHDHKTKLKECFVLLKKVPHQCLAQLAGRSMQLHREKVNDGIAACAFVDVCFPMPPLNDPDGNANADSIEDFLDKPTLHALPFDFEPKVALFNLEVFEKFLCELLDDPDKSGLCYSSTKMLLELTESYLELDQPPDVTKFLKTTAQICRSFMLPLNQAEVLAMDDALVFITDLAATCSKATVLTSITGKAKQKLEEAPTKGVVAEFTKSATLISRLFPKITSWGDALGEAMTAETDEQITVLNGYVSQSGQLLHGLPEALKDVANTKFLGKS